jgi:hypothetical protein
MEMDIVTLDLVGLWLKGQMLSLAITRNGLIPMVMILATILRRLQILMAVLIFTVIQPKTEMVAQTVMVMDGLTQTQILFGQIHRGIFLMVQTHFSKIILNGMIPILTSLVIIGQI